MNGYKWGETLPHMSPAVLTTAVINVGDMLYRDTGNADSPRAAGDYTWDTNLATTQVSFHDLFLGIALQRSRSGDIAPIRIAGEGVFEFDTASATYKVGDLVGPAKQSGNLLEPQKVASVAAVDKAIGRVAQAGTSVTKVKVRISGVMYTGGEQAFA